MADMLSAAHLEAHVVDNALILLLVQEASQR
jgi:hypothetical protein